MRTALKSVCSESGAAERKNFPPTASRRHQNARSWLKVSIQYRRFPVKQPALVVFRRRIIVRLLIVSSSKRIQIVGTQATQPEAFMHCTGEFDEAVEPPIGTPEPFQSPTASSGLSTPYSRGCLHAVGRCCLGNVGLRNHRWAYCRRVRHISGESASSLPPFVKHTQE